MSELAIHYVASATRGRTYCNLTTSTRTLALALTTEWERVTCKTCLRVRAL